MSKESTLPLKIRIVVGLFAIPSLLLGGMIISMFINQQTDDISFFEVVYSLVGIFAMYIALTGKKFF